MMIMRMFPNILTSRVKKYAQSLEILSAVESTKIQSSHSVGQAQFGYE